MTAPPCFLKCLGYPELRSPDRKVVRIRVKKHLALLVYLAVDRRRFHDRDRLMHLLWPHVSVAKGRHSIATAISLLRAIFGRNAFPTNRTAIRFNPATFHLDLDRLEAGNIIGTEDEGDLDVDGFLRGFDIDDAPEFGLWKDREQARRLPSIHAGLLTLIDHGRRRGSHDEIMQRAERLLALDHLAEEGIRAKMEALALVGDRFGALRVFDDWKTQVAEELQAEPSSLVEGMAVQLRKRGWEPKEPNPTPAVPAEQWKDRRFVGRKAEYRRLYETWEAVHQHRPQHALTAGDSGVGKTTLVQRLVTAAGLEGASVSRVQCYQMEQPIPFGMIGALVNGLLGRPGVAATAPEALAEVARVVPQVKQHFTNLPTPKQTEGEAARLLFAEGVMDLLHSVMEEKALLLVVDDLHHADEASLAVLHLLMRRMATGRFMVALTIRPDAKIGPQAHRFTDASSHLFLESIRLEPMPFDDCIELLEMMLAGATIEPPPSERRALIRASRGFPMVLELLAQDWILNGQNSLGLTLHALTPEVRTSTASGQYADLVQRLFRELSNPARQVLTLAALVGQRLNDLTVFGTVGLDLAGTMEGINELLSRRVLRDVGNGLEFMNELIRAYVYTATPSPIRLALHASVADRLLEQRGPGSASGLEIAWHLMRARRTAEAGEHLVSGARAALVGGAPDEVVLALRTGHEALAEPLKTTATLLLIEALHELGYWAEALHFSAPQEDRLDTKAFRVFALEARWRLGVLSLAEQSLSVTELVDTAQAEVKLAVRALTLAAFLAGAIRDDVLTNKVRRAMPEDMATNSLAPAGLLIAQAQLHFQMRSLSEGERFVDLARQALEGAHNTQRVQLELGAAVFAMMRGKYGIAVEHAKLAFALATRLDNKLLTSKAAYLASTCHLRLGQFEAAITAARLVSQSADSSIFVSACFIEANAVFELRGPVEALARATSAIPAATRIAQPWFQQEWMLEFADLLWLCGRRSQAIAKAIAATSGEFSTPLARSIIGAFVRWTANLETLAIEKAAPPIATKLEGELDVLDSYEVFAARKARGDEPGIDAKLALLVETLPEACVARIDRLNAGWGRRVGM